MALLVLIAFIALVAFSLWVAHLNGKAKEHDKILKLIKSVDDYEKEVRQNLAEDKAKQLKQLAKKEQELFRQSAAHEAEARQRLETSRSQLVAESESRNREVAEAVQRLEFSRMELLADIARRSDQIVERESALVKLTEEKFRGFPWLANAYADFLALQDEQSAKRLEQKTHPAYKAASELREIKQKRRESEIRARVAEYQLKYYESLFPWIAELRSEENDDALAGICEHDAIEEDNADPADKWLSEEEFASLTGSERLQRALDSYWRRNKTKWQIGRDYERFIGWMYEQNGFRVDYHGIIAGFDDLGRDLIARKGNDVQIVQCKCWSLFKTIHEKHIFQLYGTVIAYALDNPKDQVTGHFMTSTKLSERAKAFADYLGLKITESQPLRKYPCIKCNISQQSSEKIYHLPFDQQYDKTAIDTKKGEFFASTIAEAEERGFRRAFRYRGG